MEKSEGRVNSENKQYIFFNSNKTNMKEFKTSFLDHISESCQGPYCWVLHPKGCKDSGRGGGEPGIKASPPAAPVSRRCV
jgi:hypothetical protein